MEGAIIGGVAFLVMVLIAVFAGVISAVSTVSSYAKAEENDED